VILCNRFQALSASSAGKNSVKVLATLLLLSYTKLQRVVVTIFSFTTLRYPSGAEQQVWLYDANVEFLKDKHLYLYVTGLAVLAVLIIPYTLGLLFFPQLQACSQRRIFMWVNKLKPVFDSYAGPYKDSHRMWTGLLLVIRTLLIVLFSCNTSNSQDFNLFPVAIVSFILLLLIASSHGVYKKWPYDILESFFYLQLGVFAVAMMYASHNHGYVSAVPDCTIGMSLFVFVGIVCWHGLSCLPVSKKLFYCCCKRLERAHIVESLFTPNRDELVIQPLLSS